MAKRRNKMRLVQGENKTQNEPKVVNLTPHDQVPTHCDQAGLCCWSFGAQSKDATVTGAGLTPFDVWRMVTSPEQPLSKFGVTSTVGLLKKYCVLGLSRKDKQPVCGLVMQPYQEESKAKHCPFLVWRGKVSDTDHARLMDGKRPGRAFWKPDGKPRFSCGLGDSKPIQCASFPLGRYINLEDNKIKLRVVSSVDFCDKCMPENVRPSSMTVADYMADKQTQGYVKLSAQYISVLDKIKEFDPPEGVRMAACRAMFDFDGMLRSVLPEEEALKARPKNPDQLILTALGMIAQSEQERQGKEMKAKVQQEQEQELEELEEQELQEQEREEWLEQE